jgi:hypothetical protein
VSIEILGSVGEKHYYYYHYYYYYYYTVFDPISYTINNNNNDRNKQSLVTYASDKDVRGDKKYIANYKY